VPILIESKYQIGTNTWTAAANASTVRHILSVGWNSMKLDQGLILHAEFDILRELTSPLTPG
jgi:hypothetical protein